MVRKAAPSSKQDTAKDRPATAAAASKKTSTKGKGKATRGRPHSADEQNAAGQANSASNGNNMMIEEKENVYAFANSQLFVSVDSPPKRMMGDQDQVVLTPGSRESSEDNFGGYASATEDDDYMPPSGVSSTTSSAAAAAAAAGLMNGGAGGANGPAGGAPLVRKLKFGGAGNGAVEATPGKALRNKTQGEPVMVCLRVRPLLSGGPKDDDEKYDGLDEVEAEMRRKVRAAMKEKMDKLKNAQPTLVPTSSTTVMLNAPKDSQTYKNGGEANSTFSFSKVFGPEAQQKEVFDFTTLPLVTKLFRGQSSLIFAYGITNSGKTFTMQGTESQPGIMTNMLKEVFERIQQAKDSGSEDLGLPEAASIAELVVEASYLEIYQEKIYDLLQSGGREGKNVCKIMRTSEDEAYVSGLRHIPVRSIEDAMAVVQLGSKNRIVAQTMLNSDSSRSHSVFTVKLSLPSGETYAKLSVVDLAGAERSSKTGNSGARQKETNNINTSLMQLGRCLEALRHNQMNPKAPQKNVPFRDSKLTMLFRDALCGFGHMVMICNVNPAPAEYDETVHTLKYAAVAREIKITSRIDTKRPVTAKKPVAAVKRAAASQDEAPLSAVSEQTEGLLAEKEAEVEALLDQVFYLKKQLVVAEHRIVSVEENARYAVYDRLEKETQNIEAMYERRLNDERAKHEERLEKRDLMWQQRLLEAQQDDSATIEARQVIELAEKTHRTAIARLEATAAEEVATIRAQLAEVQQRFMDAQADHEADMEEAQEVIRRREEELDQAHEECAETMEQAEARVLEAMKALDRCQEEERKREISHAEECAAIAERLQDAKRALEEERSEWANERAALEAAVEAAKKELASWQANTKLTNSEQVEALMKARADLEERLAAQEVEFEARELMSKTRHTEEVEQLRKNLSSAVTAAESAVAALREELAVTHAAALAQMTSAHEREMIDAAERFNKRLDEMDLACASKIETMEAAADAERNKLSSAYEELKKSLSSTMVELEACKMELESANRKLNENNEAWEKKMYELKNMHSKELLAATTAAVAALSFNPSFSATANAETEAAADSMTHVKKPRVVRGGKGAASKKVPAFAQQSDIQAAIMASSNVVPSGSGFPNVDSTYAEGDVDADSGSMAMMSPSRGVLGGGHEHVVAMAASSSATKAPRPKAATLPMLEGNQMQAVIETLKKRHAMEAGSNNSTAKNATALSSSSSSSSASSMNEDEAAAPGHEASEDEEADNVGEASLAHTSSASASSVSNPLPAGPRPHATPSRLTVTSAASAAGNCTTPVSMRSPLAVKQTPGTAGKKSAHRRLLSDCLEGAQFSSLPSSVQDAILLNTPSGMPVSAHAPALPARAIVASSAAVPGEAEIAPLSFPSAAASSRVTSNKNDDSMLQTPSFSPIVAPAPGSASGHNLNQSYSLLSSASSSSSTSAAAAVAAAPRISIARMASLLTPRVATETPVVPSRPAVPPSKTTRTSVAASSASLASSAAPTNNSAFAILETSDPAGNENVAPSSNSAASSSATEEKPKVPQRKTRAAQAKQAAAAAASTTNAATVSAAMLTAAMASEGTDSSASAATEGALAPKPERPPRVTRASARTMPSAALMAAMASGAGQAVAPPRPKRKSHEDDGKQDKENESENAHGPDTDPASGGKVLKKKRASLEEHVGDAPEGPASSPISTAAYTANSAADAVQAALMLSSDPYSFDAQAEWSALISPVKPVNFTSASASVANSSNAAPAAPPKPSRKPAATAKTGAGARRKPLNT